MAAFVVPEKGAQIDEESIRNYCSERLSYCKAPEIIVYRDEIPRSPQGKILKRDLRGELKEK